MYLPQQKIRVNESIVCSELDDEMVLLNVETGVYFGLDAIGAEIWKLLVKGASEDEIVIRLLEEYDVQPEMVRVDVTAFVGALTSKGIVCEMKA